MASHMGIITGDRTSYEDDHQSPTAYPRSPGVIAASFTVTGGRQTTATTNAATSAEGQRAKSPQKGTSSGPPSPAYGAKAPKAGAQGPVSPPLSLLKHQAALAAHAAGQAHGDGGGGGGKSVALKSYGSRSIKGEGGGGGGADLARNKSIKTVHHAMDQSLSAQEGGGKTGAGGSSRPGSSSSRPLSGRERVSQAIEKVSSTINLGLKFNPELNMTQKTREQTREYAASVTQVIW